MPSGSNGAGSGVGRRTSDCGSPGAGLGASADADALVGDRTVATGVSAPAVPRRVWFWICWSRAWLIATSAGVVGDVAGWVPLLVFFLGRLRESKPVDPMPIGASSPPLGGVAPKLGGPNVGN